MAEEDEIVLIGLERPRPARPLRVHEEQRMRAYLAEAEASRSSSVR